MRLRRLPPEVVDRRGRVGNPEERVHPACVDPPHRSPIRRHDIIGVVWRPPARRQPNGADTGDDDPDEQTPDETTLSYAHDSPLF